MSAAEKITEYIRSKSVLILGFGREGKSTFEFIRNNLPEKHLTIADKREVAVDDENVSVISGENYLSCIGDFDLVFKSPGIAFLDVNIPEACEITCQTELFMRFCDCITVGVTGTKGKSTTSTLIHRMLEFSGKSARLVGNIGIPVFDALSLGADDIAVTELSSHQLEFMRSCPHIAVLTNIYEEHLDHYRDGFAGYVNAKLNIVRNQTANDEFFTDPQSEIWNHIGRDEIKSHVNIVSPDTADEFTRSLFGISKNLRGEHFSYDICLAAAAAKMAGATEDGIREAVSTYPGIEHRLEYFGTFGGVDYYNDAIATIPQATLAAVRALGNVGSLIIGGLDRGINLDNFACELSSLNIGRIVCLPDTGHMIADKIKDGARASVIKASDLCEAVEICAHETKTGESCLLSPAAASYNVYRDFEEKGRHFKSLVIEYYNKKQA